MDPVTLILSNLHPLLGILRSAYEQYQSVCHNREKCLYLLKRSQKILVEIDGEIIKHPDSMKDNIDRLCGGLIHIRGVFSSFARLSFLKSLLRRNEISNAIIQCHNLLEDCLRCFNLTALVHLSHFQSEYEEARHKDNNFLESKITLYASHHQETLRELQIQQQDMMDALLAMQRNVTHHQEDSAESTILKIGIECVERSSKLKASNNVPDWTVSSLEVDIDEEELGSGGFSVVRKGTWNGLLVVVKMMTSETSPQVICLSLSLPCSLRS